MKPKWQLLTWIMFTCMLPTTNGQSTPVRLAKYNVVQSFDFGEVQLLPGLMHDEFIEIKDYFMGLSSDNMLYKL